MENQINTVYILGIGAVGGLYGAKLHDMDSSILKVIASGDRIARLKQTGLNINGKVYQFNYAEPGDNSQPPADLIIIAVKHAQLAQAIQAITGFIKPDTIIISLLNGISSEEQIGAAVGMEHLLYAYAIGMDAVRQGNEINFTAPGRIVFGEQHNETLTARVEAVKTLFEKAQIPHQIPVDMLRSLWTKFMMNVGVNQASAVLNATYGVFQQSQEARNLMQLAADEVITLSRQAKVNLEQEDLDAYFTIINTLSPGGKTSMLQDKEAGRKTEVDIFAGTVIALGKKYNVPTPVNQTLYTIIKAMEAM
ncbi:ketopantoate reductase family protein [Mucilaginibacter polytrichastri]|nr:ketopantoate reductase family protein [Mucilaginibacter polytrichastri]SFT11717.1 ketopantoate reductase [Mucilaginibacter polytrichastri]